MEGILPVGQRNFAVLFQASAAGFNIKRPAARSALHRTEPIWLPHSCLTLAMVIWASSFIVLKLAFRSYDPMVVIFGRMAVASCCFLCLFRSFGKIDYHRGDWKPILLMTLCEPCLYFFFEARALTNTSAAQAGMICALLPLLVAVGARIFLKEAISTRTWAGFLLAITGAVWLSASGRATAEAPNPPLGNLLEFMAMVCATGYIIILKRLTARYSPLLLTAAQALVGSAFFLPMLFLPGTEWPTRFDGYGILAIVYLGAFVTMGAYGLYNFGISRIAASQASAFVNLIPVFTIILGRLILNERIALSQYPAVALIFIGIFLSQEIRRRSPAIPSAV
jgi:drug/metabolite transporter (DMT)-like permease